MDKESSLPIFTPENKSVE